jgi:2'-5' RNA ligase
MRRTLTRESYSVWLMPEPDWAREFKRIVDDLAERFGTPQFIPHLTLIGGRPFDRVDLARRIASLLPGSRAVWRPIVDVALGASYFRSFYALFGAEGALLALKRRMDRAVLGVEVTDFMPHISLLYGEVEAGRKAAAAAEIRAKLSGQTVRFDRLEIVYSGDDVPVENWETVEAFRLDG